MFKRAFLSFKQGKTDAEAAKIWESFESFMELITRGDFNDSDRKFISGGFIVLFNKFRDHSKENLPENCHDKYLFFLEEKYIKEYANYVLYQSKNNTSSTDKEIYLTGCSQQLLYYYLMSLSWEIDSLTRTDLESIANSSGVIKSRIESIIEEFISNYGFSLYNT